MWTKEMERETLKRHEESYKRIMKSFMFSNSFDTILTLYVPPINNNYNLLLL